METIEINGLELSARHGVAEQERQVGNLFRVDLKLNVDLSRAMQSDDVNDTINYADVIELVKSEMNVPSALLEHVAWRVANRLRQEYPAIAGGEVRIAKITPPISCFVSSVAVTTSW